MLIDITYIPFLNSLLNSPHVCFAVIFSYIGAMLISPVTGSPPPFLLSRSTTLSLLKFHQYYNIFCKKASEFFSVTSHKTCQIH